MVFILLGKLAFGRVDEGGWLILSLFDELKTTLKELTTTEKKPERDLLEILTKVNFNMIDTKTYTAKDKDGKESDFKVVPCIQHALTKDVKLKVMKES